MKRNEEPFVFPGTVVRVVDGDTIDVDCRIPFYMRTVQRFRLMGYNAPEMRGPEKEMGRVATTYLRDLLPVGSEIMIRSHKGDAFGRWLADVEIPGSIDLVRFLISKGQGVKWDGKGKRPGFATFDGYPLPPTPYKAPGATLTE